MHKATQTESAPMWNTENTTWNTGPSTKENSMTCLEVKTTFRICTFHTEHVTNEIFQTPMFCTPLLLIQAYANDVIADLT